MTPSAEDLGAPGRWRTLVYVALLLLLLGFAAPGGGLMGLPLGFILKNKLHMTAHAMAAFGLVAGLPAYLGFLFGFARDTVNPFGLRDRGFLVLFGGLGAGLYLLFAALPVHLGTLLLASSLLGAAFLFIVSAERGLIAQIGQRRRMSGQVSAARSLIGSLPGIVGILVGGALSERLERLDATRATHGLFLTGAALMAAVALFGLWRPASVFDALAAPRAAPLGRGDEIRRLARHWPIYPALLISLMWEFAPGSGTALFFHLQNTLGADDVQCARFSAIFAAAFMPTYLAFGVLCRRFPLKTLLFWGTIVGVPQYVPMLFITSLPAAMTAAALMGLMGGLANAAFMDLLIRSCPRGLEGSLLMLSASLGALVIGLGNVLGTSLYDRFGGFGVCVIAITVVYALILPILRLVPASLIETADGQTPTVMAPDQENLTRPLKRTRLAPRSRG